MRGLLFVNLVFFFPNEQYLIFFTLLVFPNFYLSQNIPGAPKHRNLSLLSFYEIMSLPNFETLSSTFWQIFNDSGIFVLCNVIIQGNSFLLNLWKQP